MAEEGVDARIHIPEGFAGAQHHIPNARGVVVDRIPASGELHDGFGIKSTAPVGMLPDHADGVAAEDDRCEKTHAHEHERALADRAAVDLSQPVEPDEAEHNDERQRKRKHAQPHQRCKRIHEKKHAEHEKPATGPRDGARERRHVAVCHCPTSSAICEKPPCLPCHRKQGDAWIIFVPHRR
mgnify:CR=1 FL=1